MRPLSDGRDKTGSGLPGDQGSLVFHFEAYNLKAELSSFSVLFFFSNANKIEREISALGKKTSKAGNKHDFLIGDGLRALRDRHAFLKRR